MIPSFLAKYKDAGTDLTAESIRDNIYFDAMADQETQLHVFNYQLPILIKETHALAETQEEEEGPTQPTQVSSASMGDANEGELSSYPRGGVRKKPIRLIIVDSITNNFRSELNMRPASEDGMGSLAGQVEGGESSMKASLLQRSADLCETGIRLRTLADQFNLAVVCVNQVSDIFDAEATTTPTGHPTAPLIAESSSSNNHHHHHNNKSQLARHRWSHAMRKLKPALGLIWENTINTRILLERTQPSFLSSSAASALAQLQFPQPPPSADSPPEVHQAFAHQCQLIQEQRERIMARQEPIRVMSVLFSPWTSTESAWCRYSIQQEGVVGVED
ncbi:hypothetical protein DFQ27_005478 [Actinomortierella ambigua]|uniref:RecA family profile 1 domain-containing protein n=1 Tax=Actinomortierella ambigua TaxID=1343610 RepID=A0A9P6U2V7_9FUNG|nr:hypothetical protein DFQ27_005478 [Actinomortierella ambigua]